MADQSSKLSLCPAEPKLLNWSYISGKSQVPKQVAHSSFFSFWKVHRSQELAFLFSTHQYVSYDSIAVVMERLVAVRPVKQVHFPARLECLLNCESVVEKKYIRTL